LILHQFCNRQLGKRLHQHSLKRFIKQRTRLAMPVGEDRLLAVGDLLQGLKRRSLPFSPLDEGLGGLAISIKADL